MMKKRGRAKEEKKTSINDIDIDPAIDNVFMRKLKKILYSYPDVFSKSPDSLPRPMKGIPEHEFKLKKGAKPLYCRRPYWGPQTRKYLEQWTRWALTQKLLEPAPTSAWASRIVIAPKFRGDTVKTDTPDDLRVCVDFTGVNQYIQK